jgi:hypothetical protein
MVPGSGSQCPDILSHHVKETNQETHLELNAAKQIPVLDTLLSLR